MNLYEEDGVLYPSYKEVTSTNISRWYIKTYNIKDVTEKSAWHNTYENNIILIKSSGEEVKFSELYGADEIHLNDSVIVVGEYLVAEEVRSEKNELYFWKRAEILHRWLIHNTPNLKNQYDTHCHEVSKEKLKYLNTLCLKSITDRKLHFELKQHIKHEVNEADDFQWKWMLEDLQSVEYVIRKLRKFNWDKYYLVYIADSDGDAFYK
jgi:hypothetical protein